MYFFYFKHAGYTPQTFIPWAVAKAFIIAFLQLLSRRLTRVSTMFQSDQIVHSNGRLTKTSKKKYNKNAAQLTRNTSHHFVMNLALLPNGYGHKIATNYCGVSSLKHNNILYNDDITIAQLFNDYFPSVFSHLHPHHHFHLWMTCIYQIYLTCQLV